MTSIGCIINRLFSNISFLYSFTTETVVNRNAVIIMDLLTLSELAENIFIFLDSSTILDCRLVNKTFKEIIENPHFYLRKLAFDGQQKHVQKIFDAFFAVREVINSFERDEKECDQLNARFYKNVWSPRKDVQFFGY